MVFFQYDTIPAVHEALNTSEAISIPLLELFRRHFLGKSDARPKL